MLGKGLMCWRGAPKPVADLPDEPDFEELAASRKLSEEEESRVQMKLDLANSFASIAENKRAQELIREVLKEGSAEQVVAAKKLLNEII